MSNLHKRITLVVSPFLGAPVLQLTLSSCQQESELKRQQRSSEISTYTCLLIEHPYHIHHYVLIDILTRVNVSKTQEQSPRKDYLICMYWSMPPTHRMQPITTSTDSTEAKVPEFENLPCEPSQGSVPSALWHKLHTRDEWAWLRTMTRLLSLHHLVCTMIMCNS